MNIFGIIDLYQHSLYYKKIDENKEMILYSLISFAFPFLFPSFQILIGSTVNAALVLSAFYLKGKKVLPMIILPSIATISRGILFGPLTVYLVYLLPFIWLGNAVLIGMMKLLYIKLKGNYVVSSIFSISAKVSIIFASTYILFTLNVVPQALLLAMGLIQVITATIGCASAYFVDFGRKRLLKG